MIVEFHGDTEKKNKVLPLEYASFVEKVRLKTEKSQNKKTVKWMNRYDQRNKN